MNRVLSIMLVAVPGIASSAFTPTKQESNCVYGAWSMTDQVGYPDGCTKTFYERPRTCDGVQSVETKVVEANCETLTEKSDLSEQMPSEQFFNESSAAIKVSTAEIVYGEIELTEKYNLYLQVDGGYVPFWVDTKQEKYEVLKLAILKFKGINVDISALSADCGPLHPIVPNDPNTGYTRNCCLPFCDPGCICWTEYCPCGYCVCEPMKDE